MSFVIGADLGGTKLSLAVFDHEGAIAQRRLHPLEGRSGREAGALISHAVADLLLACTTQGLQVEAVCICVPGIARKDGTVWAPNIEGWEAYPLLAELQAVAGTIPVSVESDRICYIEGERWMGKAQGSSDAIYLAVGTGIGAGICSGGNIIEGAAGIAGAVGWMTLDADFQAPYEKHGYFEYHASGAGIARMAGRMASMDPDYRGPLSEIPASQLRSADVFAAYAQADPLAISVLDKCVTCWGMAVANLVTVFNPEVVVLGGGVFGPATDLLPAVRNVAARWAQPLAFEQVRIEASALGPDAGLYGAGSRAHALRQKIQQGT